ncbi:hypothetical protein [Azomonas macrocytogenes]|uniref:Uncharacterized protein n=1 Tax=Azomonas macrocytogenes TaxID=69962 RepID=A0A839SY82_AZOMA|nr:hypothetical protein [Azomonas macrocytogenes]MBB3101659.1 hypothetical protein [Azomonas macrocytogenes]
MLTDNGTAENWLMAAHTVCCANVYRSSTCLFLMIQKPASGKYFYLECEQKMAEPCFQSGLETLSINKLAFLFSYSPWSSL